MGSAAADVGGLLLALLPLSSRALLLLLLLSSLALALALLALAPLLPPPLLLLSATGDAVALAVAGPVAGVVDVDGWVVAMASDCGAATAKSPRRCDS